MSEEAKFKVGDRVIRGDEDETGTVVDVMIMSYWNGNENYLYKAEFGGVVLIYVPCDLQLYETKETKDE